MQHVDLPSAVSFLRDRAARDTSGPWPAGVPAGEFTRSPAAMRVGELAAAEGLFAFHFEHRHHLELPYDWVEDGDTTPVRWASGVLPEPKYQAFRHDLAVASFHPGHRAKWGTHELCHALVGFAWWPGATVLEEATAARLAELLPVALWYGFDEAFLRRCEVHAPTGPLYRTLCPACERVASVNLDDPHAAERIQTGLTLMERELAAIAKTRRLGRPVENIWGTINLCTDGLAYARGHRLRQESEAFRRWYDSFAVEGGGKWSSLDDLEARVEAVMRAILLGESLEPLAENVAEGRERWMRQDLGARLLQVWAETDGEAAESLLEVVEDLADGDDLAAVIADYRSLEEDYFLPSAEQVFAVGYPLSVGLGTDHDQLIEGVSSAVPRTCWRLGDALGEAVSDFAEQDAPEREGIGRRFARFLHDKVETSVGELARLEAAVCHPREGDVATVRLLGRGVGPLRLTEGVELLRLSLDADAVHAAVEAGEEPPETEPVSLLVARAGGDVALVGLPEADADRLAAGEEVDELVGSQLNSLGLLTPDEW